MWAGLGTGGAAVSSWALSSLHRTRTHLVFSPFCTPAPVLRRGGPCVRSDVCRCHVFGMSTSFHTFWRSHFNSGEPCPEQLTPFPSWVLRTLWKSGLLLSCPNPLWVPILGSCNPHSLPCLWGHHGAFPASTIAALRPLSPRPVSSLRWGT